MKKEIFLLIGILLLTQIVYAKDITLSLDQKEYYFKTGENAIINLHTENTYKETINGILSYTTIQSINQGNFQMSSSNTKSTNFQIKEGKTDTQLNFGTSNIPTTLTIGLSFQYNKDEARIVQLEDIKINFVNENSEKQNTQSIVSSSSQKISTKQQNQQLNQEEQQIQQIINQMFGQEQQQQQQTVTQKLQNNQLSQDSSALRQQIQKQLEEQQALKEEFQKQLLQNQEFQKEHQDLLEQGYNLTSRNLYPEANNTGKFELNYQNSKGEQASLKGEMNNGQIQNLEKNTPQTRQELLSQLQQNKQFQEYQKKLEQQGFTKQNIEFQTTQNQTNIKLNYLNNKNETAQITAEIINKTIEKVELINNKEEEKNYWWIIPLLIVLTLLLVYYTYKKLYKKKNKKNQETIKIKEEPFDYRKEAKKLLEEAKTLFDKKEYKDSYGKAGQALRIYLSYENNLKKEITNDEIITWLKKNKKENQKIKIIKECFDICSLVEFAKFEANKNDFNKIIKEIEKIIR
ncbi:MAG: hypothetical protein QXG00_02795 [Candidatus Woesearchaeota archaeon]